MLLLQILVSAKVPMVTLRSQSTIIFMMFCQNSLLNCTCLFWDCMEMTGSFILYYTTTLYIAVRLMILDALESSAYVSLAVGFCDHVSPMLLVCPIPRRYFLYHMDSVSRSTMEIYSREKYRNKIPSRSK
jgi:hypothetical protein